MAELNWTEHISAQRKNKISFSSVCVFFIFSFFFGFLLETTWKLTIRRTENCLYNKLTDCWRLVCNWNGEMKRGKQKSARGCEKSTKIMFLQCVNKTVKTGKSKRFIYIFHFPWNEEFPSFFFAVLVCL